MICEHGLKPGQLRHDDARCKLQGYFKAFSISFEFFLFVCLFFCLFVF